MFTKVMMATLAVTVMGLTEVASAQVAARCTLDDQLSPSQARGRNAWAVNNGYIPQVFADALNAAPPFGMYVVFAHACASYPKVPVGSDCNQFVPVTADGAANRTLGMLGTCFAGCLTPTQKVMFGGREIAIATAAENREATVSALLPGADRTMPRFSEQPIKTFVAGDTQEDILLLETSGGHRLEATAEHPMVNDRGQVVMAHTLHVGDKLMRTDGSIATLVRVTTFPYHGKVWNIQPVSEKKMENILSAEGFLTGSVRFQNEWSQDVFRILLRDHLDVSHF